MGANGNRWSLFLCLLCCTGGRADEFTQVSRYSVRMFSYGLLSIDTRVGDIHIDGWDEPRLEIEAEKVVRAGNREAANSLYGRLTVVLKGQDRQVELRTLYPPRRVWQPFRGESQLSVNYTVRMPFDANLALRCVDGNVWIRGLQGKQRIERQLRGRGGGCSLPRPAAPALCPHLARLRPK